MYGVCTVFLARKQPNIRSYAVQMRFWPTLVQALGGEAKTRRVAWSPESSFEVARQP
jgi:hypothetical protein